MHHARRVILQVSLAAFAARALHRSAIPSQASAINLTCRSRSGEPKLTILSVVIGLSEEYVGALQENRALEAYEYDYEICEVSNSTTFTRPVIWTKIAAIQELLSNGRQRIVWMDADAFFVVKQPFEEVTRVHHKVKKVLFSLLETKDIIMTDDHPLGDPCNINTGVMVMKNSDWTRRFWQGIWDSFDREGQRIRQLGLEDQSAVCVARESDPDDFNRHVRVVGHSVLNNVGKYRGTFIAHIAGGGGAMKYQKLLPHVRQANERMARGNAEMTQPSSDVPSTFRELTMDFDAVNHY